MVCVDVIFWIDMLLSFRSGFVDGRMTIRMSSVDIVRRYLSYFFWVDLIANFPYDALAASMPHRSPMQRGMAA